MYRRLFKSALAGLCALSTLAAANAQVTGSFTVDNSYQIWIGDSNGVLNVPVPTSNGSALPNPVTQQTNTSRDQIREGESFSFDPVPDCHIYLVAWSDDIILQGAVGSFAGDVTLKTGDPEILVAPSGVNKQNNQFPTASEVHQAIQNADNNNLWTAPTVGTLPGQPGPMASIGTISVPGLDPGARWVWYDSGRHNSWGAPFAGFNHDEFLVFRVPCNELVPDLGDPVVSTQAGKDDINIDMGTYTPEKETACCTPLNEELLQTLFKPEFESTGNGPFRMKYQPSATFHNQMQKYIDLMNALDPATTSITIHFRLGDAGPAGTVPTGLGSSIAGTNDTYMTWTAGGNGTPSNGGGNFWNSYGLQPNRQYVMHTGTYFNEQSRFSLSDDCAGNGFTFAWRIQEMPQARVRGEFIIGAGKETKSIARTEFTSEKAPMKAPERMQAPQKFSPPTRK